jgi:hypothetical protein
MKNKETHYLGQFPYYNENQGDHDIILMKIKVTLTKKLYASILLKIIFRLVVSMKFRKTITLFSFFARTTWDMFQYF